MLTELFSDDSDEDLISVGEEGAINQEPNSQTRATSGANGSTTTSIINVDPQPTRRRLPSHDHDVSKKRKRSKR